VVAPGAPAGDGCPYDSAVPEDQADQAMRRAFGVWVRELRHRRGQTQAAIAQQAAISVTYLSEMESGHHNPTLAVILRLARALDITPSQLVSRLDNLD
jgi:XRE family transcriptional regulator, regulator of sulfur utilization